MTMNTAKFDVSHLKERNPHVPSLKPESRGWSYHHEKKVCIPCLDSVRGKREP